MAEFISSINTYSLAEWLRDDCPGPILMDGKSCINDMSLVVGETKGLRPKETTLLTSG